ncbi:MAG: FtsX-like permease family protein, partial [Candidatus Heimdallarchaeaceae archaeon]
GTNLLMLENISAAVYEEISEILEGYGYQIMSMEKMIEQNLANYNNFKTMFKVLGGIMFVIFAFQIIVYSFLYFLTYRKDFELLYRLGIKKKSIYGSVITAILLQIIPGIALGSYFGSIIGRYFLVPYAVLSNFPVIIISVIVGFILIATTSSIYASRKGLEKVIA